MKDPGSSPAHPAPSALSPTIAGGNSVGTAGADSKPGGPVVSAGTAISSRQSLPGGPGGARLTPGGGVGVSGWGGGSRRASRWAAASAAAWSSSSATAASSIFCQVATPSGGGLCRSRLRAWRHSFRRRLVSLGTTTVGLRAVWRTPAALTAQGTQYGGLTGPNGYTRQSAQKGPPQLRHRPSATS